MMPLYVSLPIICVLIIFSVMFAMSDMAYSSVNILRLKKECLKNKRSAKIAYKLATKYDDTISTILFCNNITNIGISSLMVSVVAYISTDDTISSIISICISTFILLLCGEIIPKQIAKIYNFRLSLFFSYFILICKYIFYPFTFIFTKFAYLLSKIFIRKAKNNENLEVNVEVNDELQEMVSTIEDEGIITEDKADFIRKSIEFNTTEAYEIMTPRVDVLMFDINDDINELISNKEYFLYSRIPINNEDKDDIIGILPLKLLQRKILTKSKIDINELMYKPIFVPRSMKITDILSLFKTSEHHFAVVLDEYGGVEGILTIEDIIEEITGPIFDETDKVEKDYYENPEGLLIVSGSMNIDDFFELVNIEEKFDDPSFNTVSGWVIDNLERFANVNDEFDYQNLHVKVLSIDEYTVDKIEVKINKIEDDEEKSED